MCGVIGPFTTFLFIALAISQSLSWFHWTDNALSDLGNYTTATESVATLFNFGLIIGGCLNLVFAFGLIYAMRKRTIGLTGTFVFALADLSLIAIGIFPETSGCIHFYVSVAFFSLFPISMFFMGASITRETSERALGLATILFGIFAVMSAAPIILAHVQDVGIHELLAALSGATWSIVLGVKLFQRSTLSA